MRLPTALPLFRRLASLGWVLLVQLAGCSAPVEPEASTEPAREAFAESAAELGLAFRHESGARGRLFMPETLGSGVGLVDYDGDGDLDVYLVQGGWLDARDESGPSDRLFHSDLVETGNLAFRDVTESMGLLFPRSLGEGYGQGVAVGDFDRDGDEDLFVTAFGADRLLRNDDGRFTQVDGPWSDAGWSTGALFVDLRGDAQPELFVARYLDYSLGGHKDCFFTVGTADYCKPLSYGPMPDRLYALGGADGGAEGWADISTEAGLAARGNGLGVVAADFDGDGRREIFVANDQMANHLFTPGPEGLPFREEGSFAGVALSAEGKAEASMGVVATDFDGDGELDLLMTHLAGESHTLYRGLGGGLFDDASHRANLSTATLGATGFGVAALDYDGDGWVDLAVANGKVHLDPTRPPGPSRTLPLDEPDQLLRNEGGRFYPQASRAFEVSRVGRGLAVGDLDNDGDADLVFNDSEASARVLMNSVGQAAAWVGFELVDAEGLDPGEGLPVILEAGGRRHLRLRARGGSYLSSSDPRVLFGLGSFEGTVEVTVGWLGSEGGRSETFGPLETGRYHRLKQGQGRLSGDSR